MENILFLKSIRNILLATLVVVSIAMIASVVKIGATNHWLKMKDNVACFPSDVEHSFPLVYYQTAHNPISNDAYLKTFVEQYIRLTREDLIVNYHRTTDSNRYEDAKLSNNKFEAIGLSVGEERVLNMRKYAESNNIYYDLKKDNKGYVFLIDDILIRNIPDNGTSHVVVRGEYQIVFDKVKQDLPPALWGYREIHLFLVQGVPTADLEDQYENKYGIFVSNSIENILSPVLKDRLTKRNIDHEYIIKGDQ